LIETTFVKLSIIQTVYFQNKVALYCKKYYKWFHNQKREKLFLGVFYLEEIELRCILDDPLHAYGVTFQSRLVGNDGASASGLKKK
jgi:hypothetical protein